MFKKVILAALIVTSAVFAQVNVGGRAAFTFGTSWGGGDGDKNWGAGFAAGIDAKVPINQNLAFVPGLEVELRRISDEYESRGYTIENSLSMWYLDIPLLLRINANPQFFFDVGLGVGFNLSSEVTMEADGHSESADVGSQMETVDLGAIVGFGVAVMPNLDVNVRATIGFTEMAKEGEGSKNLRFQAGVTYWFM